MIKFSDEDLAAFEVEERRDAAMGAMLHGENRHDPTYLAEPDLDLSDERPVPPDDWEECTCVTTSYASASGDGYGGGHYTDRTGCPMHDPDYDEPWVRDDTPPDFGPPGSGAVVTEYTGFEPGLWPEEPGDF